MKKMIPLLVLLVFLTGCNSNSETTATSVSTSTSESTSTELLTFTLTELAQYNGKNGQAAYVAINGIVYDVTNVSEWANGVHENGLTAGQDLSDFINQSPHGQSVLGDLPIIGELVE